MERGMDLRRHISLNEKEYPHATGEFSRLLGQISLAAKIVSNEINHAGLADILGYTEEENPSGERQARLDQYADTVFTKAVVRNGGVCAIATEERQEPLLVETRDYRGKYVMCMDPLDGSSNINYNVSIGTIFGIYRRVSGDGPKDEAAYRDCLQVGRNLVAAGYVVYGSSTMLVYTTGNGVHGFTLDSSIGEFLLSHPDITIPDSEGSYSANETNFPNWRPGIQESVKHFRRDTDFSSRYIGSLVADVHRNLLKGGIFLYPDEPGVEGKEEGKMRLLYEAAPLAKIVEEAGGRASDGTQDILDIEPESLHQTVPLYIGNQGAVDLIEDNLQKHD